MGVGIPKNGFGRWRFQVRFQLCTSNTMRLSPKNLQLAANNMATCPLASGVQAPLERANIEKINEMKFRLDFPIIFGYIPKPQMTFTSISPGSPTRVQPHWDGGRADLRRPPAATGGASSPGVGRLQRYKISHAVGCQHTGLQRTILMHLGDLPHCSLPTYRATKDNFDASWGPPTL